jgi:hypothetical protein
MCRPLKMSLYSVRSPFTQYVFYSPWWNILSVYFPFSFILFSVSFVAYPLFLIVSPTWPWTLISILLQDAFLSTGTAGKVLFVIISHSKPIKTKGSTRAPYRTPLRPWRTLLRLCFCALFGPKISLLCSYFCAPCFSCLHFRALSFLSRSCIHV